MAKITKEQYEFALARIEELLPMVDDNTPANDRNAVELTMIQVRHVLHGGLVVGVLAEIKKLA